MKKFRTWDTEIEEIEVKKETHQYVTEADGQRWLKRNDNFRSYFDTFQDAKAFLIDREKSAIVDLLRQIAKHEEMLREIEEMTCRNP